MMTLICIFSPASLPQKRQIPHSRGVGVKYEFVKRYMISGGELGFGTSNESDALQPAQNSISELVCRRDPLQGSIRNVSLSVQTVRLSIGLAKTQVFSTYLATYHPC